MPAVEIAAALARLVQGKTPLLLKAPERSERARDDRDRAANVRERERARASASSRFETRQAS